jgi:hypothetical protein
MRASQLAHEIRMKNWLGRYDSKLCKSCQRLGDAIPSRARVPFSDCQEHFMKRVVRLRATVEFVGRLRIKCFS